MSSSSTLCLRELGSTSTHQAYETIPSTSTCVDVIGAAKRASRSPTAHRFLPGPSGSSARAALRERLARLASVVRADLFDPIALSRALNSLALRFSTSVAGNQEVRIGPRSQGHPCEAISDLNFDVVAEFAKPFATV